VINRTVIEVLSEAFAAPEVFLLLRPVGLNSIHLTHGLGQTGATSNPPRW